MCKKCGGTTKKSISALELKRKLGHKRYKPIGLMLHKIRSLLGKRDSLYEFSNYIEPDEGSFESVNSREGKNDKDSKRGKGSQRQFRVLMAGESKPVNWKSKPDAKVGSMNMIVPDDLRAGPIRIKRKTSSGIHKRLDKRIIFITILL